LLFPVNLLAGKGRSEVRLVEDNCGAGGRGRTCEGLAEWVASFEGRKKGVKGTWLSASRGDGGEAQVVGKLFAEKPSHAYGIAQTLGEDLVPNQRY
jgi:hypothetical protein